MTPSSVLVAVLLRTAVIVLGYLGFMAVLSTTDSTDALGAGLLFFLLVALLSGLWAVYDGLRRGLLAGLGLWMLTAVVCGAGLVAAFVLTDSSAGSLGSELRDSWLFFALLVGVPAVPGTLLGGLARRLRRRPQPEAVIV